MLPSGVSCEVIVGSRKRCSILLVKRALGAARRGRVLFMSKRGVDEALKEADDPPIAKDALKRISFAYPESGNEVASKCSEIHAWRLPPEAIVLDGLDDFLDPKKPRESRSLCAALLDAAKVCSRISNRDTPLYLSLDERVYEERQTFLSPILELYFYQRITFQNESCISSQNKNI